MTENKDNISREEMGELRKKATRGARWTAVTTGTRIVTQFVQIAILARLLSVADFGLYEMMFVTMVVGQAFGDAGITNAIIHFQDATRKELSSLYWLNVTAGCLVYGIIWLAVPLIARLYSEPRLIDLLRYTAVIFIITPIGLQFQVLLERQIQFRRVAFYEVVAVLLGATVSVTLALRGAGVMSLVGLIITQATVKATLLASFGWRKWRPQLRLRWSECRRFVRFGIYQMGDRGLNIFGQHLDKLLIGFFLGMEPLGYYGMAYKLIVRPYQMINPIFTRVAFPVFSKVQNDLKRLNSGYLELIGVLSALMFPVYGALIVLAEPVVLLQFGPKYVSCIPLIRILSIVGMMYSLGNPFGSVLLARGRADIAFYLNIVRVAGFAIGVTFAYRFGLQGIAWSLVAVVVGIMFPAGLIIRWKLLGMSASAYIKEFMPFLLITGVIMGAALAAHELIAFPNAAIALAVILPVAGLAYVGLLRTWHRQRLDKIIALIRS